MTINEEEESVIRISFYSGKQILVKMGWFDVDCKADGIRKESFEIASDEQLIRGILNF